MRQGFARRPKPVEPAVVHGKNYTTPDGLKRLIDEREFLLTKDRPAVVEVVSWAAGNGDRSENADYQYGKRRLRQIDGRIRFLTQRIESAEVVDPEAPRTGQRAKRAFFGATVRYENASGAERTVSVVGIDEVDLDRNHLSWASPLGRALLAEQGRATELANGQQRIDAIARDYAAKPDGTLIVSPDNRSRQQINEAVRVELQKAGKLGEDAQQFQTLSHRSDMTGPDRTWAAMYRAGDVVQYERSSKAEGIESGAFGVVRASDSTTNRLTVELADGASVSYDPKRVYGVNVYREVSREVATGDRIQFSALNKELGIANRDMGTVTSIEPNRLTVRMDGKEERSISFNPAEFRHFDHGYAVTSHSSQGLTSTRVLANFDTDSSRSLINQRLAYVAISRASEDARIYTNDAGTLGQRLATDATKSAALDFTAKAEQQSSPQLSKEPKPVQVHEYNHPDSRLAAVATDYARQPERTVIVATNKAEREELTQLARADLYAQGKLGREAIAVPVLVEKKDESRYRVESPRTG